MECVCVDCNKSFMYGDEGDNEDFCLRCQYLAFKADFGDDFEIDLGYDSEMPRFED